jgi:hypothetical protein
MTWWFWLLLLLLLLLWDDDNNIGSMKGLFLVDHCFAVLIDKAKFHLQN